MKARYLFFVLLSLCTLQWTSCDSGDASDCEECNAALQEYFRILQNGTCNSIIAEVEEKCSDYVRRQAVGVMLETCNEGAKESASCQAPGRENMPVLFSVNGDIPEPVYIELGFGNKSVIVNLDDNESVVNTLPAFVLGNEFVDAELYVKSTNERVWLATPKVTYDRSAQSLLQTRVLEVNHDDNNGWRLFVFNWD